MHSKSKTVLPTSAATAALLFGLAAWGCEPSNSTLEKSRIFRTQLPGGEEVSYSIVGVMQGPSVDITAGKMEVVIDKEVRPAASSVLITLTCDSPEASSDRHDLKEGLREYQQTVNQDIGGFSLPFRAECQLAFEAEDDSGGEMYVDWHVESDLIWETNDDDIEIRLEITPNSP